MTHPYASAAYAQAFGSDYEPVYLEEAQTFILKRSIPGTGYYDAMGCYPLCPIANGDLEKDFGRLGEMGIVSLVLVTDPFFHPSLALLERHFDKVMPYKEHYLNDLTEAPLYESKNHHYKVRRALKSCDVRMIELNNYLDEWCRLYDLLIARHKVTGITAFPRPYFKALSDMRPLAVGAFVRDAMVACQLWLEYQGHVYSHLVASDEIGYDIHASYALYDFGLRYFADNKAKIVDLGGGLGMLGTPSGGLDQLKKGFSNKTGICYLCSKILDRKRYDALSAGKQTNFFPAYRG